jgi:hypothetical protein
MLQLTVRKVGKLARYDSAAEAARELNLSEG